MPAQLTDEHGAFLVRLARRAIEEYLRSGAIIRPPEDTPEVLWEPMGVFVTLNKLVGGQKVLRGCIGFPYPQKPLVEATIEAAIASATEDPRFPPMRLPEMDEVVVEVSVLTRPELVRVEDPRDYPRVIKVGRDGLIVEKGFFRGLLLPQVPVEWGWDEETFLSQCCMKAGLYPDAWLDRDTRIYRFQAVVFEEEEPRGPVRRREFEAEGA
ncbi:TIGR00296 family protein [Candidatus Bathyarchaeota archaeon]|nr:MAG: TIGR00296 family protein [Candidatus Bathyarchaeota archaeon]